MSETVKIIDYIIAAEGTPVLLRERVGRWMTRGYVPFGGIAISDDVWAQAMVKYELAPDHRGGLEEAGSKHGAASEPGSAS